MECLSPILSNTTVHGRIWLPCSKCIACKQKAGRDWFIRLKKHYESQTNPSYFVTLTYSPENLPFDELTGEAMFNKPSIQNFIKQVRNVINRGFPKDWVIKNPSFFPLNGKISYFTIAERGDLFGRPHYHLMMFNIPYTQDTFDQIVQYLWPYGRTEVGTCTDKSMCYITDYMVTKDNETTEWRIMSKGIGENYILKHFKTLKPKMEYKVPVHDKTFNMPRYYRKKLYSDAERKVIGKKIVKELEDKQKNLDKPYHVDLQERIVALEEKVKFKREKRMRLKIKKLTK